jgi:hypothetical protein
MRFPITSSKNNTIISLMYLVYFLLLPEDKKNVPSRELQNITTASKLDDHYVW